MEVANILFKDTLSQMDISWSFVTPYTTPLVGFTSKIVKSKGKISLPMTVRNIIYILEFLIVSTLSPYNYIMGRPTLNQLQARISTCDLFMKFPDREAIHVIYGDQNAPPECCFATVKEVEIKKEIQEEECKSPKMEPERDYELFVLHYSYPHRTIKIRRALPLDVHMKITKVLVEFKYIFAWQSTDLGIVPKDISKHKLGFPANTKPIFLKKRAFSKTI